MQARERGPDGSHFSPVEMVQTGDVVTGNNTVQPDGTWVIASTAPGRTSSTLTFKPVAGDWGTAYHVLEAYGVTTVCNLYPKEGVVNFTSVAAAYNGKAASPLAWQFMTQVRARAARAPVANTTAHSRHTRGGGDTLRPSRARPPARRRPAAASTPPPTPQAIRCKSLRTRRSASCLAAAAGR